MWGKGAAIKVHDSKKTGERRRRGLLGGTSEAEHA